MDLDQRHRPAASHLLPLIKLKLCEVEAAGDPCFWVFGEHGAYYGTRNEAQQQADALGAIGQTVLGTRIEPSDPAVTAARRDVFPASEQTITYYEDGPAFAVECIDAAGVHVGAAWEGGDLMLVGAGIPPASHDGHAGELTREQARALAATLLRFADNGAKTADA